MPARPTALLSDLPRLAFAALAALLLALHATAVPAWDADRLQQAAARLGPRAQGSLRELLPLLQQGAGQDDAARLAGVNEFFNRHVLFRSDAEIYGVVDHWASPLQTLAQGQGDCEDYAIAKYFALLAMGMPVAKLRLVYVRAELGGTTQAHMVLAYYAQPAAEPLILDNLIGELRPASRRPDLQPVFSFNSEGLWQGTGGAGAGDPLQRLSRWREVMAKVRAEGFL